jgi:hypothetical protein
MVCVTAGLRLGGVTVEGPEGEVPPQPAAMPQRTRSARSRYARIGAAILSHVLFENATRLEEP